MAVDAQRRTRLTGALLGLVLGVAGCGTAGAEPAVPPTGVTAPAPMPFPPPQPPILLAPAEPVWLDVPALGVHTDTVVPLGLTRDGSMEVPESAGSAGWYTGAPPPGALGPAVLVAHVDWRGDPGLFHDLGALIPGDVVVVGRADGTVTTFRVTRIERHPKDVFPTQAVYGSTDTADLRLITCGGQFDRERRSYLDNVVVFATLVDATPLDG